MIKIGISKIALTLVLMAMIFVISGCSQTESDTTTDDMETPSEEVEMEETEQVQSTEDDESDSKIVSSLKELAAKGKSVHCTFNVEDPQNPENVVEQDTYISGSKFMVSSEVTMEGETIRYTTINDGDWMYIWSSNMAEGSKFNLKKMAELGEEDYTEQGSVNSDVEYDLFCVPWVVDNSKFEVPTDIEFMDWSNLAESMAEGMCDSCNNVPEEDRASCLEQFNCA